MAGDVTERERSLLDDSSCEDPPGLRLSDFAGVRAKSLTRRGCRGTLEGDVGETASVSPELHRYDFEECELRSSGEAGWTKMKLLVLATGSDECDR